MSNSEHQHDSSSDSARWLTQLDVRIKLIVVLSFPFALLALPVQALFAYVLLACALLAIMLSGGVALREYARFMRVPLVFLCVVALSILIAGPQDARGGQRLIAGIMIPRASLEAALLFLISAGLSVSAVSVMVLSTPLARIFGGLSSIGFGDWLASRLALSVRLSARTMGQAGRMLRGMRARGYAPKRLWRVAATGRLAGVLFLRSVELSERMERAMIARAGHADDASIAAFLEQPRGRIGVRDWLILLVWMAWLAALIGAARW